MATFNGLGVNLGNLWRLSDAKSRSISPENFGGARGKGGTATEGTGADGARDLGVGWKVSPSVRVAPGETFTAADIEGAGAIEHIWMTLAGDWRLGILRIYWDDQEVPSVECPVGAFFACGWGEYAQVSSIPICVNPGSAFNSYWEMPFRKRCRITVTNISPDPMTLYYQVDYTLTDVPDDAAHFHAQFRRVNGVPFGEVYTILDGVKGAGQFVGTYMMMSPTNSAWWGEGEVKIYLDDDSAFPTICGTGTEDYFCGSYDFVDKRTGEQREFTTPYSGLPQIIRPDGKYETETRFGMYRFHITDPIRFSKKIRVTAQDLGWTNDRRYLPRRDDISTVAYWYQTLPTQAFPALPDSDGLALLREPNPQ
jgi:hypothetical protein